MSSFQISLNITEYSERNRKYDSKASDSVHVCVYMCVSHGGSRNFFKLDNEKY